MASQQATLGKVNSKEMPCQAEPGKFIPVIDPSRCEAKGPCVPACPYSVLELLPLSQADKKELSWLGRLKAQVHGNRRAFVSKPDDCHACGYCVSICPEKAISLRLKIPL
jgi:NAD-dependent dihydropyrimidine dehydrogenase PreA subunit